MGNGSATFWTVTGAVAAVLSAVVAILSLMHPSTRAEAQQDGQSVADATSEKPAPASTPAQTPQPSASTTDDDSSAGSQTGGHASSDQNKDVEFDIAGGNGRIYISDDSSVIHMKVVVPDEWKDPFILIDMNQDGRLDPYVDKVYAEMPNHQSPCYALRIADNVTTQCGAFQSGSTLNTLQSNDIWTYIWEIPKGELTFGPRKVVFGVNAFDQPAGRWSNVANLTYEFRG